MQPHPNEKINKIRLNIDEISLSIKRLMDEMQEKMKTELTDALVVLFDEYPEVKSVHFTAYTPFFNDGEECTYSCNAGSCSFNERDEYGDSTDDSEVFVNISRNALDQIYDNGWKPNPNFSPRCLEAKTAFQSILGSINDNTWRSIVGDHVSVTITRDGITTEEYDHE